MNATTPRLLLLASTLLAACGTSTPSGGSSAGTPPTPNLFLKGAITAREAGQIEVSGVAVATPTSVRIEGAERPESELKLGMQVKVKAHGAGRRAEGLEIEAEDAVKGTVDSTGEDRLVVGGQTVRIDDSTEFEDPARRLGAVAPGQRVRVSGVPDDRGGLRATRVEATSDAAHELELKGFVSGVSTTGFTLRLSPDSGPADTYQVTLAAGVTLPPGVVEGAFVEVRSAAAVPADHAIVASSVALEDARAGEAGGETEVEGLVTSGSSDLFMVAGTSVATSAATRWDGGLPADLAVGVKVEAEGVMGGDGVLVAARVRFEASGRLIGQLTGLAGAGGATTFAVNGVAVAGDGATDWRTAAAALAEGQWVEVRGQAARAGAGLVASRIELRSRGNGRPVIQGVATAFDAAAGTVTILGATVTVDGATEFHGHEDRSGLDGPALGRDAFFSGLTAGVTVVKGVGQGSADWTTGPTGAARSLELQGAR
jgi:hypothetical protein